MEHRRRLAQRGERLAAWSLRLRGYRILARNLRTPVAEVDLLARKRDTLIVIEVKSRRGRWEGTIGFSQQQRLARAALWLLPHYGRGQQGIRIDMITVRFGVRPLRWPRLRHYEGVIAADILGPWY
ncbi:MAG: YraN family protein [Planctomycetota bacterium]